MSEKGSSLDYHRSVASSSSSSIMSVDPDYTPEFSPGMRPEIQQLYRPDDRSLWDEAVPEKTTTTDDVEAGSYAQECALIVRREPHPTTHRVALYSITVQSPLIRQVLSAVFAGFDGLNTGLRQLTFTAPFHPFYHRWHRFDQLRRDERDAETRAHLDLLHPIVRAEILPHVEAMRDLTRNGVVSFDRLWTIFTPGMILYARLEGRDRFLELAAGRYGANMGGEFFGLECRYVDGDGRAFGYVAASVDIARFDGVRRIVDLDAMPAHVHPDVRRLTDRLHARGAKLERLNGFRHMAYSGFYVARGSRQVRKRHVENSRIIIDPQTFSLYGMPGPGLATIEPDTLPSSADGDRDVSSLGDAENVIYKATREALVDFQKALATCEARLQTESPDASRALSSKQRLLCAPTVRGYCLAFKTWAEFYVEDIHPIHWSENAFPKLVLPHGYKDIIRAFVQEQLSRDDKFDDIVYGKGLGFIMLLSGEPGVGKTLTAESVAEEMRQPLYLMSASELGETATEVEESLEQVLELANKWNAILLLDECDMFLEARSTADVRRNRLVSVFLRQLEYYRGVMFLTSNRVQDFDAAFESRIHLTIPYPALDATSRLHVWNTFVRAGDTATSLSEADLAALARLEINGRQIKNIVKTARLLAKQDGVPLGMAHVQMVLSVKRRSGVTGGLD